MSQVENSAGITMINIADTISEQSSLTDKELLSEATVDSQISIYIADGNGKIVSYSDKAVGMDLDVINSFDIVQTVEFENHKYSIIKKRVESEGNIVAYLLVAKNLSSEYSFLRITVVTTLAADAAGIVIALFIGFLISKRMLRPIDKITTRAKEISISDLNGKIELRGNDDELDRLAKTFNEMIDRLRLSFEKQNSFVSDASHELRTPIAVIRGYIDLVDRWGKGDKAVLEEAIDAIKNETKDMGEMVERLLFLARSDAGALDINKEKFSLNELIEELIMEYKLIFPENAIVKEIPDIIYLNADKSLIKQALRALIDNSIKFDPKNHDIIVSAKVIDSNVKITVQDFGQGIPAEKVTGIFERFYRVDSARERKTGGTGLGLAIVQMIVQAHAGSVKAESEQGKGTLMTIYLPDGLLLRD